MTIILRLICPALLLVLSPVADAHPLHAGTALGDGFLHPLLGWDHLLAMLAVGLWAVQRPQTQRRWAVPALFVSAVAAGALLGQGLGRDPMIEALIAGSLIVLGLLLALRLRTDAPLAFGLLLPMGAVHGWAHGVELPAAEPALPFVAGFLLATALLHALGAAAALALPARGRGALRIAGLGVGLAGCGLLLA